MLPRLSTLLLIVAVLVCIASALRKAPPPKRCRNGITGICRKGSCPKGSHCIKIGSRGICCRDKPTPKVICRWGSNGKCGGKMGLKCRSGGTCKLPKDVVDGLGECCRDKPTIPTECKYGINGLCSRNNPKCPKGSKCSYYGVGGLGRCCRSKPAIKSCPGGPLNQHGICGGIANLKCPVGSQCMYKDTHPDGSGICCGKIKPPGCPFGSMPGFCSIKDRKCPKGSTCRFFNGPIGLGTCCRDKPGISVCPGRELGPCNSIRCPPSATCIKGTCCRTIKPPVCLGIEVGQCITRKCPPGSTCIKGKCCRSIRPPSCPGKPGGPCKNGKCPKGETCIKGQCCSITLPPICRGKPGGPCKNGKCPKGETCIRGQCCRITLPPVCPGRELGECKNNKCPPNAICIRGTCCRSDKPPPLCPGISSGPCKNGKCPKGRTCVGGCCLLTLPIGFCPPDSGRPGICMEGPNSCRDDSSCPKGQLCCREGCGKVCKKPIKFPKLDGPKLP